LGHAEYHCTGCGLRNVVLFDHKGFAVLLADYYSAFHMFLLLLAMVPRTFRDAVIGLPPGG